MSRIARDAVPNPVDDDPCYICEDERECTACDGLGEEDDGFRCYSCGGTGYSVPEHCCVCGGSPYCNCCPTCGGYVGTCGCPIGNEPGFTPAAEARIARAQEDIAAGHPALWTAGDGDPNGELTGDPWPTDAERISEDLERKAAEAGEVA